MKYTVTAYTEKGEFAKVISCRYNAAQKTLFKKCMNEIGLLLIDNGIITMDCKYNYDLPNVWRNGCVGSAWFINPFINVSIQAENGAHIAL